MRRMVTVAAFLAAVMSGPSTEAVTPTGTPNIVSPAPCSQIKWRKGVAQRERLVRCLFRGVPGGATTALAIARCESGPNLDPRAEHQGSLGLFQHQRHLWRARALRYLTPRYGLDARRVSAFNAYANAVVTAAMVRDRDIRWTPWSCA